MIKKIKKLIYVLLVFFFTFCLFPQGKSDLTLELLNIEVVEVLKIISQKNGNNIVINPNVKGRVTLFLNKVSYEQALQAVLESASLAYVDDNGIMKIMPDAEYEKLTGYSFYDRQKKQIINIKYSNASDIAAKIVKIEPKAIVVVDETTNSILIKSSDKTISELKKIVEELDKEILTLSCHLKYLDEKQAENLIKLIISPKGAYFLNPNNKEVIIKDYEENSNVIMNLLKKHDVPGDVETRTYELNYAKFDVMEKKLKELLTKDVGQVLTDERTNKIIITDLKDKFEKIELLIENYDVKDRQVLIEAKIVQVLLNDSFQWGINWQTVIDSLSNNNLGLRITSAYDVADELITAAGFADSALKNDTISEDTIDKTTSTVNTFDKSLSTDEKGISKSTSESKTQSNESITLTSGVSEKTPFNTNVSYPGGMGTRIVAVGSVNGKQFEGVLNALKSLGETKVLSSPRIITLNNQEAKILVASKEAYVTSTTVTPGSGPSTTSENVTFMDVGITLSVTPLINKEDFITLNVKPSVSSVTETLQTASGNKIPIVSTQEVESKVQIKNGTTIVLGGIHEQYRYDFKSSLPILGDIPIIGYLFRKIEKRIRNSELVIFITPRIITGEKNFYELENKEMNILGSNMENYIVEQEVIDKAIEFEKNESNQ